MRGCLKPPAANFGPLGKRWRLPEANSASPTTADQRSAPSRRSRRDARPASRRLFDVLDDRDSRVAPRTGIFSRIPPECVPRTPPITQPSVLPWQCAAPGSHFVRGGATWFAGFRRHCNGRRLPALVRYRAAVLVHRTDAPGEDVRLVGWHRAGCCVAIPPTPAVAYSMARVA